MASQKEKRKVGMKIRKMTCWGHTGENIGDKVRENKYNLHRNKQKKNVADETNKKKMSGQDKDKQKQ